MRGGLGPFQLAVEVALGAGGRVLDVGGFEGDGYEVAFNAPDDVGVGEDRLTGGAGEDSTSLVVDGVVDEQPEDDGLLFFCRGGERVEEAGFPRDLAPGDVGDAEAFDLGGEAIERGNLRWRLLGGEGKCGGNEGGDDGDFHGG